MDMLTGQIEPGNKQIAVTNNRLENSIENGSDPDGDPISTEQKITQKLVVHGDRDAGNKRLEPLCRQTRKPLPGGRFCR